MKKFFLQLPALLFTLLIHAQVIPVPLEANKWAGYVGCLSAQPGNPDRILAAGGYSGLYETINGGLTWGHINSLPAHHISFVSFCPTDRNIILIAAQNDTRVNQPSGIWRSDDGCRTWNNIALPHGSVGTDRCPENSGANGISWIPGTDSVIVGTFCGLAISPDKGVSWSLVTINPGGVSSHNTPDWVGSVIAVDADHFVVNTYTGSFWTNNRGANWYPCRGINLTSNGSMHAFTITPTARKILWYYNYGSQLLYSLDSGRQWNSFYRSDMGGNQPPFVKATSNDNNIFELFLGNGTNLYKIRLDSRNTGAWTSAPIEPIGLDHSDPQEILFHQDTKRPYILSGDGGIQIPNTADERHWHSVGGGRDGFNGLDVTSMGVQSVINNGITETNIYYSTWHNSVWWSPDNGLTWSTNNNGISEGKRVQVNGPLVSAADARISLNAWDNAIPPYGLRLYGRGFELLPALEPLYRVDARDVFLRYIKKEGRECIVGIKNSNEIYLKPVDGGTWRMIYRFPSDPDDVWMLYDLSIGYQPDGTPVLYQPFVNTSNQIKLKKIIIGGTIDVPIARVEIPAMNNFSLMGQMMDFGQKPVLGADPANAQHLIAADIGTGFMKESFNGGNDWVIDTLLTNLVTEFGRMRFLSNFPYLHWSQAQVINFNPFNNQDIYVATLHAGVIASRDGGITWDRIRGSEEIKFINSIGFTRPGWVYFGGHARGIWKYFARRLYYYPDFVLDERLLLHDPTGTVRPWEIKPDVCLPCVTTILKSGMIQDLSINSKTGEPEVIVSDMNSIFQYYNENGKEPSMQFTDVINPKSAVSPAIIQIYKSGRIVKGFITENGKLRGLISADKTMMDIPANLFFRSEKLGSKEDMNRIVEKDNSFQYQMPKGFNPSINLQSGNRLFINTASPGEWITITGGGFEPISKYKHEVSIWMGGLLMDEHVVVDDKGSFSTKCQVPARSGNQPVYLSQQTANGIIKLSSPVVVANTD